ncbi:cyclic pyranopterin monophosphate synthase MoaC [Hymenobacter nivis]|uniref:cyclic pyranopterin monophosphate synthase n=1 Tax=Hymenobacter nivis TaxID=1850093 RepID=A0A2Z3GTD2_9BACT|nr:cyclic pyranopterin monophosphate synthase MoaC [Hymenobacter nivis]AWM34315.1 cyclic pyranopterin monophosphate synthase MoaC [Hymenobacter nivis]
MLSDKFTHVNAANQPTMVDVGQKVPTRRLARAHCRVVLGPELLGRVRAGELPSHKGPVIHTAILAGIMGAKKTADLIPLCHPLGLDDCQITIEPDGPDALRVVCTAVVTGRTGVEMEALTGASVAALTIYDMCKAFSHDITITGVQLVEKTGGKRDFLRPENS